VLEWLFKVKVFFWFSYIRLRHGLRVVSLIL
jgi:hypothetical protein